jgi:hypothetical protein
MTEHFDPHYTWLGIRPEEQPPHHYRLLGLREFEENAETIQNAADRQMAHLRTFQAGTHAALSQKLLNEVAAAKVCLLVPEKKAAYDAALAEKLRPESSPLDELAAAIEPLDIPGASHHVARRATPWSTIVSAVVAVGVLAAGFIAWHATLAKKEKDVTATPAAAEQTKPATPPVVTTPVAITPAPPAPRPPPAPKPPMQTSAVQTAVVAPPTGSEAPPARPVPPPSPVLVTTQIARPPAPTTSGATEKLFLGLGRAFLAAASPPAGATAPAPPPKLPIPSAEIQQSLAARVSEVAPPLDAQAVRRDRLDWAKRLWDIAMQPNVPANERFVILRRACEVGCSMGDVGVTFGSVERMGRDFDIDVMDVKAKMLYRLYSAAAAAADANLARDALEAFHRQVQQAEMQGRYELASDMLEQGYALFQGPQRASLRKDLRIWQGDVQKIAAQWEQVQAAMATLKQNENDPQANLTVGRWYCFWNGKPALGWPYLAKGSDEELRRLAEQELSDAAGAEAEAHMGDAWLALGRSRYGDERSAMLVRASYWYQRTLDAARSPAAKAHAEKRLEEIVRIGRPAGRNTAPRAPSNGLRLHLRPGSALPREVWLDLMEYADLQYSSSADEPWKMTGDGLSGGKFSGSVPLNVSLSGDYDMEMQFTRAKGDDAVLLVFLVNGRQCTLGMNVGKQREWGFKSMEGELPNSPQPVVTTTNPGIFTNNQRHTVLLRVRLMKDNASVEARFDGRPLAFWAGPQSGVKREVVPNAATSRPILATFVNATFHSVRARLFTGNGYVLPTAGVGPTNSSIHRPR